jgi:hypothetical protein
MKIQMRNAAIVFAASTLLVSIFCNQETSARGLVFDTLIVSPCWSEPPDALSPWFNTAKIKIEKAISANTNKFDDELSVAFLLDENGGVEDPIIVHVNNVAREKAQAEAIVNLLNKCIPFEKPPDELLHKQRILLLFRNYPKFFLEMDTFAGYKIWKDRDQTFQDMKKMIERDSHLEKIGPGSIIR